MLVVVATGNANTVLNMGHRSHWAAANTAFALVVMLAIDLLLVPRIGIVGAAIGWACAMVTDAVLGAVEVRRGLGLRSADASVLGAAGVVLAAFGLPAIALRVGAASFAPSAPGGLVLIAGTAAAAAGYAATLYLLRDRLALAEVAGALRRPRAGAGPPAHRDPIHRGGQ